MKDKNELVEKLTKTLETNYPLGVPRKLIEEATGGILNKKTIANLDSMKRGISGSFKLAGQVIYPPKGVAEFLVNRNR